MPMQLCKARLGLLAPLDQRVRLDQTARLVPMAHKAKKVRRVR